MIDQGPVLDQELNPEHVGNKTNIILPNILQALLQNRRKGCVLKRGSSPPTAIYPSSDLRLKSVYTPGLTDTQRVRTAPKRTPPAAPPVDHSTASSAPGTVLLLLSIVGWAAFFILQNKTLNEYPAPLSLTALVCLLGTVEGGVVAAIMEHRKSAWVIGFDSRLLAAAYSGIVCSGLAYYMQSVVNKVRGPVFVTAFSPLTMIITAVLGAIILSEQVHLGSLIGALIIVFGLYSVVWGKSKENSAANKLAYDEERAQELPATNKDIQGIVDADIIETTVKSKSHQKKNSPHEGP
ncbi:UNVERIFIED_CONTAM: WAT1-related protein [Sesamum calycinum]|uniref:WAT1-related protein n=1 Tax=Sesamum calycinum TaxID=2727403 RepID=A0AAW2QNX0_9LAMI